MFWSVRRNGRNFRELKKCFSQSLVNPPGRREMGKTITMLMSSIFLLVAVTTAYSADWLKYGEVKGDLFFYDVESVCNPTDDTTRFWTRMQFREKVRGASYMLVLNEIRCPAAESRVLSFTAYDDADHVIENGEGPSRWESIPPNSVAEVLYREICPVKRNQIGSPCLDFDPKAGKLHPPALK
jgi:Surface-adhesin protein E